MRCHLLRLPMCLAVAGLLAALGSASAQGKKGTLPSPYAPVVAELHQTRVVLQQANHDYDGFRAKAVHDIGKAMHALDPNHKHKTPAVGKSANNENQGVSDMQLAQAAKQLQTVINQLTTGTANTNSTAAVAHLQTALGHLNTALKIK
jgi:hypothetical protein